MDDLGFHFSVLSEFRSRLIEGGSEEVILTTLLNICKDKGWLKERGKQRTDERAYRSSNSLDKSNGVVVETLRAELNSSAVIGPFWLRSHVPQEWYDSYERRMEDFHFPKEASKFVAMIEETLA